jgi:hypothetical protein
MAHERHVPIVNVGQDEREESFHHRCSSPGKTQLTVELPDLGQQGSFAYVLAHTTNHVGFISTQREAAKQKLVATRLTLSWRAFSACVVTSLVNCLWVAGFVSKRAVGSSSRGKGGCTVHGAHEESH